MTPLYHSPSGRYTVSVDRITDTLTGRSIALPAGSVACGMALSELLDFWGLPEASAADDCPQCGEPTETLREGCCEPCRAENQRALDEHNAAFDRWEAMSDSARAAEIRRAGA